MKKVLILSSKSPYPIHDGAAIRTFQSICLLSELGYNVDVLYISENNNIDEVRKGIGSYCKNIYNFVLTKKQSYLKVLLGLFFNRLPLQVNYFYSIRVKSWIRKNACNYDMVYCNNIRTAIYARGLKIEKIIDYVDAYSMNYQQARDKLKGLWHWIYTIDYSRCNNFEQEMLHEFDKRLIISDVDKEFILSQVKESVPICVIENFVAIEVGKRVIHNDNSYNLLFVGAMNYEPNVTAVCYFCKWVLPALLERYPKIKFYIVGKTPTPEVKALANDHIIVTGYVNDVWDYLKEATIVVTPMQSGSGLQNKILQAMAVGSCVVTTPKGYEGFVTDEGQLYIAKNSKDMIKTISYLLDHPEERKQSGERAVQYVKRYYGKEIIKRKFSALLLS